MTDSIFHGLAIGLSLLSSVAPGTRISMLDFGRALGYLGRAGWDNDNTLQSQGERYLALMRDMRMIDEQRGLTQTGHEIKNELTLPIHMSLLDIAGQQNPGGPEAVRAAGEAEWAAAEQAAAAAAEPEPQAAPAPAPAAAEPEEEEDEWQDVGPGAPAPAPPRHPRRPRRPRPPRLRLPPAAGGHLGDRRARRADEHVLLRRPRAPPASAEPEPPAPAAAPGMTSGDPLADAAPRPRPRRPSPPRAARAGAGPPAGRVDRDLQPVRAAPPPRPPRRAWPRSRRHRRARPPRSWTRTRSAPRPRARACGCRPRPTPPSPPRSRPAATCC